MFSANSFTAAPWRVYFLSKPQNPVPEKGYLWTGQTTCHDTLGREIPCSGSGQDAEFKKGEPWPELRFEARKDMVLDRLTGLEWTRVANFGEHPIRWDEALELARDMNQQRALGHDDWRIPNRRELRSLLSYQTRRPALPKGHPFSDLFLGWYWTSTSMAANPAYAWYVQIEGARTFFGQKTRHYLAWPVRGPGKNAFAATGQTECFDADGHRIPCEGTGQDGQWRLGAPWPVPRFEQRGLTVLDRLTGLEWMKRADLTGTPLSWAEAFEALRIANRARGTAGFWRLPNVNELESLLDMSRFNPALPGDHPFDAVRAQDERHGYWSSTTSLFEPDWAWAVYPFKGTVGVGQKKGAHFHIWPVLARQLL